MVLLPRLEMESDIFNIAESQFISITKPENGAEKKRLGEVRSEHQR
jgi:hypothetical protein